MPYLTPDSAPVGTICRRLFFPNSLFLIAALNGALTELLFEHNWDATWRSPALGAAETVDLLRPYIDAFFADECGEGCFDEQTCADYTPAAGFITYAPQNPFTQSSYTPPGYPAPPFYIATGVFPSPYQAGDVLTDISRFPIYANLIDIIQTGLPRFRVHVTTTDDNSQVELHLLTMLQGGYALITVDSDPLSNYFVDLNSIGLSDLGDLGDLLNLILDGGLGQETIQEITIPTAGVHHIDLTFIPNVSAEEIVGFGGGFRKLTICNATPTVEDAVPEFQLVNCDLQWRANPLHTWISLGDVCGADGADGTDGDNGRTPTIWNDDGVLKWAYADDIPGTTQTLIDLSSLLTGEAWTDDFKCRLVNGISLGIIQHNYTAAMQAIYDGREQELGYSQIRDNALAAWGLTPGGSAFFDSFVLNTYDYSLVELGGLITNAVSDLQPYLALALQDSIASECAAMSSTVWDDTLAAFQGFVGVYPARTTFYEALIAALYPSVAQNFGNWFVEAANCDCTTFAALPIPYCREFLFETESSPLGWTIYNDGVDDWGSFVSNKWEGVYYQVLPQQKGYRVAFEIDLSKETDVRLASLNVWLDRSDDDTGENYTFGASIAGDKVGSIPIYADDIGTDEGFMTLDFTGVTTAVSKLTVTIQYFGDNTVTLANAGLQAGNLRLYGETTPPVPWITGDICIFEG